MERTVHATVHLTHPISDADLARFSRENPGWRVERDGMGSLHMSPTSAAGGAKNAQLTWQLVEFARRHGGTPFDSNAGFTLPDGSVLSPDGAWIREERWAALGDARRDSYAPIVPDVWIELRSKTDNILRLQAKLKIVRSFGASYVLMIDPYERITWFEGSAPTGLRLDLEAIFDA
jgi:Uma2 family endonuclease